jgi:hypothetical protein
MASLLRIVTAPPQRRLFRLHFYTRYLPNPSTILVAMCPLRTTMPSFLNCPRQFRISSQLNPPTKMHLSISYCTTSKFSLLPETLGLVSKQTVTVSQGATCISSPRRRVNLPAQLLLKPIFKAACITIVCDGLSNRALSMMHFQCFPASKYSTAVSFCV